METKLQNLVSQVGTDVSGKWIAVDKIDQLAELIVKECAQIAVFKDSGTVATADVAGHMAAGRSIAARLIKEHFGVE
jgi:hypothetical protein